MVPLVLFLIYMNLPGGQQSEQQEVMYDIGIMQCNVSCGTRFASDIDTLSCYVSNKDARHWSMRRFAMSFAPDIEKFACSLSDKDTRHKTMKGFVMFLKTQISAGVCSYVDCKSNTHCVERRLGGAICVENWTSALNKEDDNDGEDENDGDDKNEVIRTSEKGSNPLESKCSSNRGCPADRKFVCFARTKTCKCEPGYSFNPANNSCVRRCKSYGNSFTTYLGLRIKAHNDDHTDGGNARKCFQHCIRENKFTCVTIDTHFFNTKCFFSKSGYLDVPPRYRLKGSLIRSLHVRNCA